MCQFPETGTFPPLKFIPAYQERVWGGTLMSELLKRKKRMQEAGKGLKALRDSGLTREEVHALVDEVFNTKG